MSKHHHQHNQHNPDRPVNKATMDEPQEEFIEPEPNRSSADKEHGSELQHATHENRWEQRAPASDGPRRGRA